MTEVQSRRAWRTGAARLHAHDPFGNQLEFLERIDQA